MSVCSAAWPAETTDTLRRSFVARWRTRAVKISAATWESTGSSGASSMVMTPFWPSMTTMTSRSALPWISRASKPENFIRGPK